MLRKTGVGFREDAEKLKIGGKPVIKYFFSKIFKFILIYSYFIKKL